MHQTYALQHGGHVYTLTRCYPDPLTGRKGWSYRAWRDGLPWSWFKSKKAFEEAVSREPNDGPDFTKQHVKDTYKAIEWSEMEGRFLLEKLKDLSGKKAR